jgi:tRNA modification GTPase
MFSTDDTIVAVATPPGHGGIGVVRISGACARRVASHLVACAALEPRQATFTRARAANGSPIDEVVATLFPSPRSYTGEDVVEISAHGSPVLLSEIVRAAIEHGARLAEPGEFTLRAFLNGRIDLAQAEAVADLVNAVTPGQARAAFDQLNGTLTTTIAEIERGLFDLAAKLEASLDFPDEGYHFLAAGEARAAIGQFAARIDALLAGARRGRALREGRVAAICGRPNVGKSSLFNRLLGFDRAIVTAVEGTTRDLVDERVDIEGVPVRIVDTAGMRDAIDEVEVEGIARAGRAVDTADVVVVMVDRSRPLEASDRDLCRRTRGRPRVLVANKSDLPPAWTLDRLDAGAIELSLATGDGLEAVRRAIGEAAGSGADRHDLPSVTNARHTALLERARGALGRAASAAGAAAPEEIVLEDLGDARAALEEVTGARTSEDLLRNIFQSFCIGK